MILIARGRESAVGPSTPRLALRRGIVKSSASSLDVDGAEAQRQELLIGDVLAALVNAWRPVRGDR